jgi:outer membrane protein OmpA-like peptidoglycan-associated protein
MARILAIFSFVLIISLTELSAQNPAFPYGLSMKSLFMDYQSQNGGDISNFSAYHHGFEISVQKSINSNINIVVPFKYGVVRSHDSDSEYNHKRILGLDAQVHYQFFKPETVVIPYVLGGVGAVTETEGKFNIQIPFGVGLHFKVAENAFINWQSEFRYALEDDRNNLHHGLGFTYLFGAKKDLPVMEKEDNIDMLDSDNDGLEDDIDLCPQIWGPKELKGCPDRDDDGIPDYRDDCPSIKGIAIFKGCPDTDGDGVSDSNDECPNLAGTIENKGCPDGQSGKNNNNDGANDNSTSGDDLISISDQDGDGVADSDDNCPSTPGSVSAKGCPDADQDGISDIDDKCPNLPGIRAMNGCPDSDGDGIDDSRDKCPNTPGSVASNGCPGISDADLSILETAMRAVSFDTGKATLKPTSYPILNQIANIMERYPNYNLTIEGHSDNVGSAVNNQLLSERRARSCYEYLQRKGISTTRMNYAGYGEVSPIAGNSTLSGRSLNRRVEFNLTPR